MKVLRTSKKINRQILLKSKIATNCDFCKLFFFTCEHWKRCNRIFNLATTIFVQQRMMQIPSLFLCNNIRYIITVFCGQIVSFYYSKLNTVVSSPSPHLFFMHSMCPNYCAFLYLFGLFVERHAFSPHIKLKLLQEWRDKKLFSAHFFSTNICEMQLNCF